MLDIVLGLEGKATITVVVHANEFHRSSSQALFEKMRSLGVSILEPAQFSWFSAAANADAVISDQTSMAIFCGLLNKPVMFPQINMRLFQKHAPFVEFYRRSRTFTNVQDLRMQLKEFLESGWIPPPEASEYLAKEYSQLEDLDGLRDTVISPKMTLFTSSSQQVCRSPQ